MPNGFWLKVGELTYGFSCRSPKTRDMTPNPKIEIFRFKTDRPSFAGIAEDVAFRTAKCLT